MVYSITQRNSSEQSYSMDMKEKKIFTISRLIRKSYTLREQFSIVKL